MTENEGGQSARYHIDDVGPVPPWRQVADHLLGRIEAGEFADGKLPRQKELTAQYDVAQSAVTDAVAELRDNGVVYTIAGQGTFLVPRDGEVPAKRRTRKTPPPEIGRPNWQLIDFAEASHVIERLNAFAENIVRLLEDISHESTEACRFAKSSMGRLAHIEYAVGELIKTPERERDIVPVKKERPTSRTGAKEHTSRNSRTRPR